MRQDWHGIVFGNCGTIERASSDRILMFIGEASRCVVGVSFMVHSAEKGQIDRCPHRGKEIVGGC